MLNIKHKLECSQKKEEIQFHAGPRLLSSFTTFRISHTYIFLFHPRMQLFVFNLLNKALAPSKKIYQAV